MHWHPRSAAGHACRFRDDWGKVFGHNAFSPSLARPWMLVVTSRPGSNRMLGKIKSTSGIIRRKRFMKQTLGVLLILFQTATGAAVAQVSGQVQETTAESAPRTASESWMNRRDERRDTQLHWMAFKGDAAAVERLLEGGADVNKAVDNGNTPLHLAAFKGHKEVIAILLDHGARPGAVNDAGLTALDWARRKGHQDVEKMLLARGTTARAQSSTKSGTIEHGPAALASAAARPQAKSAQVAADKGNYRIQLGSFTSRQSAVDTWEHCRRRFAGLLGDLEMKLETVDLRGGVYHRLQTGEFSVDSARGLCAELERLGQPCIVVSPALQEPRKVLPLGSDQRN